MATARPALGLVLRNLPAQDAARIAHHAEQAGFTEIFFPENGHASAGRISGRDPFALAAAALQGTTALRAGPGVAATVIRPYYGMAITAASIQEASSGRFLLGCGVSHASSMHHRGEAYPASPLAHARDYLTKLAETRDRLEYGADFPVWLSALGPRMLELAATLSDGVMLNWMNTAAARTATDAFRAARPPGRAGATTVLYLRTGSADALREEAAQYARFDNYRRHFERQGLDSMDAVTATTCLPGDRLRMRGAIAEYRRAGIDIPAVYPVGLTPDEILHLVDELGD
jgi:alkanesulfonate monooxygenase SsuD/methylene tetrahydromethanopterin reductase-like flavin-dependent oxidoreductase (luciferase family)